MMFLKSLIFFFATGAEDCCSSTYELFGDPPKVGVLIFEGPFELPLLFCLFWL